MATPSKIEQTWSDPEFHQMPHEARRQVMSQLDPSFSSMPQQAQDMVLSRSRSKFAPPPAPAPEAAPEEPGFLERTWEGEFVRPAKQVAAGVLSGAGSFYDTLHKGAKRVGELTGTEPGGLFEDWSEDLYRRAAEYGEPESVGEKIARGVGEAAPAVAKYGLATRVGGPVAGMGGVEALAASDEGLEEAVKAGLKGAAMGGAMKVMAPASRAARAIGGATLFGSQAAAEGGDVSDVVAGAVTGAGLTAPGGRGRTFREARVDPSRPVNLGPEVPPEPVRPPLARPVPDAGPVRKGPARTAAESAEVLAKAPPVPAVESARAFTRPERELGPLAETIPGKALGRAAEAVPAEIATWAATKPKFGRRKLMKEFGLTFEEAGRVGDQLAAQGIVKAKVEPGGKTVTYTRIKPAGEPAAAEPAGRRASQRGSISPRPLPDTRTPGQRHADEMIAEQEAAREASVVGTTAKKFLKDAKKKLVDSQAPVLDRARAAQEAGKYELLEEYKADNAIDAVRRSRSAAAVAMKNMGLLDMIQSFGRGRGRGEALADIKRFNQYLIAKYAPHVAENKGISYSEARGIRRQKGESDAAYEARTEAIRKADEAFVREAEPQYAAPAQRLQQASTWLLEYGADAGLISRDLSARLRKENPGYVPLQRIVEVIDDPLAAGGKKGPAGGGKAVASQRGQSLVKKLKGANEKATEDPLQSVMDAYERVFLEASRNRAADIVASYRNLPGWEGMIEPVKSYPGAQHSPKNHFFVRRDGKTQAYKTTPELASAVNSLDEVQLGVLERIIAAPLRLKKTLTTGVNPDFAAANMVVDALTSSVQANVPVRKQIAQLPKALWDTINPGKAGQAARDELVRQGGGFTYYDFVREAPSRTYEEILAKTSPRQFAGYAARHPLRTAGEVWRAAENLSAKTEQAGRMRIYQSVLKDQLAKGRTMEDARSMAVRESNNALPNYMRRGDWTRALNGLFLYMNAGIQGNRSFLRAARDRPQQTAVRTAVAVGLPAALAAVWNLSDEERAKAWADIPEHEKENNLIVLPATPVKDETGKNWEVLKVKAVPGFGSSTIKLVNEAVEKLKSDDPVQFGQVAEALVGYASPIASTEDLGSNLIPEVIKPEAQQAANYDYFRQAPIVSGKLKNRPTEMQAQPWTSGTARQVGEATGVAPVRVEQYIKDRLGGAAPEILHYTDQALAAAGVIPEEQIRGQSISESVSRRFTKARTGATQTREYEAAQKAVENAGAAVSEALSQPSKDELIRLGVTVGKGQKRQNETDEFFLRRVTVRAQLIDRAVDAVMNNPSYKAAPDEKKEKALKAAIREADSYLRSLLP